jgi:hypothetical protein
MGLTLFSPMKAPRRNWRRLVPLLVDPSTNMARGANLPVVSICYYLSIIVFTVFYLESSSAPLFI